MDYFLKVKNASLKVAAQGINLIQNVGQDIGLSVTSSADKRPVDDFIRKFQTICQIFDNLAKLENDAEAEMFLHESKIHGHIKGVLMHLHTEDEAWYLKSLTINNREGKEGGDYSENINSVEEEDSKNDTDFPCFDVFLQNRYMDELCSRGRQDKPKGSLVLVLVMVTSILRNIRYPLLPYQTVHKSIYQLILDASSISSMYNSISKSKQPTSRDFPSYVKKVDTQLVNLIASLWTKISDNPDLLNFFMFVDKRNGVKRHLDAISCLIPLMGKPKIGVIAKEALLTSIRMHDPRIDSFILEETNLKMNIIAELQKKYQNCVAALSLNISSEPISTGTNRPTPVDSDVTNNEKSVLNTVESFVKVLHFCAAVVATASPLPESGVSSIRPVMLKLFVTVFLQTVKSSLLDNGEEQVLSAQSVLRRMLLETFSAPPGGSVNSTPDLQTSPSDYFNVGFSRNINPLCTTITTFICNDEEILQVLVRRIGSVSRSVSVSTIQLLSSLLSISSLSEASGLVIGNKRDCIRTDEPIQSGTATDVSSEIYNSLEEFLFQYMNEFCDKKSTEDKEINVFKHADNIDDRNNTSTHDSSPDVYTKASMNHILGKLASSIESLHINFCSKHIDEFGPIFLVSLQKLQNFLSLKYDEQLAVTGLVNKCIIVLLASILNSPTPAFSVRVFHMLSKFFESVQQLKTELQSHKTSIPDFVTKFEIIREVLAAPNTSDPQNRRIVDKENRQVVRILESCIIIDELIREMEGSVLAFKQLLFLSAGSMTNSDTDPGWQSGSASISHHVLASPISSSFNEDSWSTDDEHDARHDDIHDNGNVDEGDAMSISQNLLTMDNFLLECENMELQLEEVLSALSS